EAQHHAAAGDRRQQDRESSRIGQQPSRDTEAKQHRKAWPGFGQRVEAVGVTAAPAGFVIAGGLRIVMNVDVLMIVVRMSMLVRVELRVLGASAQQRGLL